MGIRTPRSNSPAGSGDFVEALFQAEIFRIFPAGIFDLGSFKAHTSTGPQFFV
jgi:hypothetical protein